MKLLSLIVTVALCAISSVECGCNDEHRRITDPDDKKHVLCIQFKKTNCLQCKANGNYLKCDTQPARSTDSAVKNGPAPDGLYAIGSVYTHGTKNRPWANLYTRKKDGDGWWDYYRENPDVPGLRSHIALHPGLTSLGCVTVKESCWSKIESMLKSKSGDYITVSKTWWRTDTVKRIGVLRVMN